MIQYYIIIFSNFNLCNVLRFDIYHVSYYEMVLLSLCIQHGLYQSIAKFGEEPKLRQLVFILFNFLVLNFIIFHKSKFEE